MLVSNMPAEVMITTPCNYINDENETMPSDTALFRGGLHLSESSQLVHKHNPGKAPITIVDGACSNGATGYSLLALINQISTDREARFTGYDISPYAISAARTGIFTMLEYIPDRADRIEAELTSYGFEVTLPKPGGGARQIDARAVAKSHQVNFEQADLCKVVPNTERADLVMANNILYWLKPDKADKLIDNLIKLLNENCILNIGCGIAVGNKRMGYRGDRSDVTYADWLQEKVAELDVRHGLKPVLKDGKGLPAIFARS